MNDRFTALSPTRRQALKRIAGVAAAGSLPTPTWAAADYPTRPVRLIEPYAPGGTVDVVARVMADKMAPHLGQPVVVEHRPGAAGTLGAAMVAKGPKDGSMFVLGTSSSLGFAKLLNKDLAYDPVRDFTPVAMVGSVPVGIFVSGDSPFTSLRELVAAAKAKPGEFSYGSTGALSLTHLAGEILCQHAGIQMVHVPYTGGAARYWSDLLGGRLQVVFAGVTGGLAMAREGRLRMLAVATRERSKLLPDIPAAGEVYGGYDVPAWFGFAVAAGTPAHIVNKLEAASLAALRDPATRPAFAAAGVELDPIMGSRELAAKVVADNRMWEKVLREAGLLK